VRRRDSRGVIVAPTAGAAERVVGALKTGAVTDQRSIGVLLNIRS